jgi:hypothetical protein
MEHRAESPVPLRSWAQTLRMYSKSSDWPPQK